MNRTRCQVSPEIESNLISVSPTPSNLVTRQSHANDYPTIASIIWTGVGEQRISRRRSLHNILGNAIARDERNKEQIIRESLRQVNRVPIFKTYFSMLYS